MHLIWFCDSGVSFLYNADVMTSAHLGPPIFKIVISYSLHKLWLCISNCEYINVPFPMIFSLFLRTAHMWLCVQTQYVQITLWCSNFNTVNKVKIQCPHHPLQFAQNASEWSVLENFPLQWCHNQQVILAFKCHYARIILEIMWRVIMILIWKALC